MKAVLNKDSMLKASKWLVLALFGLVLLVLKVVWAFVWGVFFGKDGNEGQDDTSIGSSSWTTDTWGKSNYDENGIRRW